MVTADTTPKVMLTREHFNTLRMIVDCVAEVSPPHGFRQPPGFPDPDRVEELQKLLSYSQRFRRFTIVITE